jgi:hydrogenase maturation factor
MADFVDIAIPVSAQAAAESLGLRVVRNITTGTWIRRVPRDEAEIAVECLRDWGFAARIVEVEPGGEPPSSPITRRAA